MKFCWCTITVDNMEDSSKFYQPNPHVKFFYVKDPNGVAIQFVENM